MKITLLTYGSRGDVQPFAALALGLQKAGHTVRLAAPHRFTNFAAQHGLPFAPLAGDPEALSARLNDAGESMLGAYRTMRDYVASIAGEVARDAFAACDDADLIVHSFLFTTGGHSLARARGIPDVSAQAFPMFAPTRAFPNVAMSQLPPGPLSYFSHWLATQLFWRGGNTVFRKWRATAPDAFDLSLTWPFDASKPVYGAARLPTPLLFAYSPILLPKPEDWTSLAVHVTGYLFLDAPETYQPPQELVDFLAAGEVPVCVTFGSMVNREAGRIGNIVLAALERTRQQHSPHR
jgi:sterol 3beta-glucosyltransferase